MTVAPIFLSVIAFIAGHPTQVSCDADTNPSPFATAPGATVTAWTLTNGTVVHALPSLCLETQTKPGTLLFADALATMIHEAARDEGIQSDSCVEMLADVGVYDALRRFWNVPFFSRESEQIGSQVLYLTRRKPASYQPETCWSSGVLR